MNEPTALCRPRDLPNKPLLAMFDPDLLARQPWLRDDRRRVTVQDAAIMARLVETSRHLAALERMP